jgi:type II secretory pathway pseudopilin PulG/regulation of enolase protein 1 (concanavalin A-like superfamily)
MQYKNEKNCLFRWHRASCKALTILEIIIALAIITIIFAVVLPQFRVILNGWDSRQANAEVLQNGRVLIDHINRNLSKAVRITAVEPNVYIQFLDNDSNTYQYDINPTSGYVRYGRVGYTPSDLAGPVSSLTFTCYDVCDTLLSSPIDANYIRFVEVETTFINSVSASQNKTLTTSAYLRTNAQGSDCWQNQDIGNVGAAGSANESDGSWIINASGVDIWNNTDEFHYVYQSMSGDGQIIARVVSVEYTDSWAKAGVMIRETLDGDSKHAMMVVTPGNGTAFQRRTTTAGSSDHTPGSTVTAPYWVKLVRSGNTFTGYESPDGSTWTLVGSDTITMATDVYIGLAVTSHSDGVLCTAVIDNVGFSTVTYEGFTEAKVSSDGTSITIPIPGSVDAVNILGSWETGTTHAKESGTNRALIFTAHAEHNNAACPTITSVTYGGRTMTKIVERYQTSGTTRTYTAAFILNDADITAATTTTFTPTWSASPYYGASYYSVFLRNVDQTTLYGATASNITSTGATITTSSALATSTGDMVIDAATCSNTGTYTTTGFTKSYDLSVSNFDGVAGYKSATGAAETPSVTHSTTNGRQSLIGFVVNVNEEVRGIEGDLLIAAVATDGDTSSSLEPSDDDWNKIDVNNCSNAVTLGAWWKLAEDPESASHEFTWSAGNPQQAYGWMMHFTGHNSAEPINDYSTYGVTNINPTSPEVTTTVNNCLILRLGAFDNDNITVDNPGLSGHAPITMDKSSTPTVEFVAAGTAVSGTGAVSPVWPTHQANDIGIMVIETGGEGTTLTPSGWTHITGSPVIDVASTAGSKLNILWKRAASSSEASVSTGDSGNHQVSRIYTFRGVIETGDPWNVVATGAKTTASTTATAVSVTTTVANTLVLLIVGRPDDSSSTAHFGAFTNANLINITERGEAGTTSGHGGGFVLTTGDKATTGATGISTSTKIASTTDTYMTIALKPVNTAVSGGAGYVGQSSSGDSGTSTFALTASNVSQMLTIAIAPADTNSCEGSIQP